MTTTKQGEATGDAWDRLAAIAEEKSFANALAGRVKQGAALLDADNPRWFERIALDKLAMDSCDECILGQIDGDYIEGCRRIAYSSAEPDKFLASDFGFTLKYFEQGSLDPTLTMVSDRFEALADLWRREVRARLVGEVAGG